MNTIDKNIEKMDKKQLQGYLANDFVQQCLAKYREFKDIFDPFIIVDDVEKLTVEEWECIISRMRREGVKLEKPKHTEKQFEDKGILTEYTKEELQKLYDIVCVPEITQYFIDRKKANDPKGTAKPFIRLDGWGSTYVNKYENEAFTFAMASKAATRDIEEGIQRTDGELRKLKTKKVACEAIAGILMDEEGMSELFDFVCNHLQYATLEELETLMKVKDTGFEKRNRGRQTINKKVVKIDISGNVIATYENRQECIDAEGISKSVLSKILSPTGKNKAYKGYMYKEIEN